MTTTPRVLHSPRRGLPTRVTPCIVAVIVALAVGCAGANGAGEPQAPAPGEGKDVHPTENEVVKGQVPTDLLGTAISDAARRTAVDRTAVRVVSAEAVTWRDGSLGCPQPGMAYTDALVPGYRIVLEAGGRTLEYHSSARGEPQFCPADRVRPPAPRALDPT